MSIAEKLATIAENEQKVFDSGKKAEYDFFWGVAQEDGSRINYQLAFSGSLWNNETFKPKYDMRPNNAERMFHTTSINGDLVEILENLGVVIDTSQCTVMTQMFSYAPKITRVGVIHTEKAPSLVMMFYAADRLVTIDKLILKDDGSQNLNNAFYNAKELKNITIEGKIGHSGLSLDTAPKLTHESLMSFINALFDFSATGGTHTATFGSTNLAKLTDAEKAIATQKGWTLA